MKKFDATVLAIDAETATLETQGATFSLPKKLLPEHMHAGQSLSITVKSTDERGLDSDDAKAVLNELLS